MKNVVLLAISLAIFLLVLLLPTTQVQVNGETVHLTSQGKATLAVLTMAVFLWMTEAVAFPITGLLAMNLLVITRAVEFRTLVRDGFGSPIVLFILGVMLLSAAINETNLLKRVASLLLLRFGHRPKVVILLFISVGALLSAWISDMAVAAILLPLAVSIAKSAGLQPRKSNFARALLISCAWGPIVGGVTTPAGCAPNPLTVMYLKELAGVDLSFVQWMVMGIPGALLMIPCSWLILIRVFPFEELDLHRGKEELERQARDMGALSRKEILTIAIFGLTVLLWVSAQWLERITGGTVDYLSISFVVIATSSLFFLPGIEVLSWKKAEEAISWGGIVLIMTGLSIGMAVYNTGAAEWLATVSLRDIGKLSPVLQIFVTVLGVSLLKVLFSSNTVTGTIIVPLLIALSNRLGINPVLLALPAGMTSSLSFILVTSSPTNVIPYAAGYFSIRDMAKAGLLMTVPSCICITIGIAVFGSLFGIITW